MRHKPRQTAPMTPPPHLLSELTPDQWALWKRHPISALVFDQYLPQFREMLIADLVGKFLHDKLTLHGEQAVRGMVLMASQMENLNLGSVRVAFGLPSVPDDAR